MRCGGPRLRPGSESRTLLAGASGDLTAARYAVGIVNFRTYDDLERCLTSVKCQSSAPELVVVVDHDADPGQLEEVRERHPEALFEPRPNRGFASGANAALRRILARAPEARFALILNPDVELQPDFAQTLLTEMTGCPAAALATGKLLRPEGPWIDSAGIYLPRHRRPRDRGSEQRDRGQFDRTEFVLGASGAALMIRLSALEEMAIDGEVFDEDFFVYHEDTDLAWRANLLGWRVLYVPAARAVHKRRWRRHRRFAIEVEIRRHSFKNHYLQMIKNEQGWDFLLNLPVIASWEIARLGYALVHDRAVLAGYRQAWKLRGRMWKKRRILQRRARAMREPRTADRGSDGSPDSCRGAIGCWAEAPRRSSPFVER